MRKICAVLIPLLLTLNLIYALPATAAPSEITVKWDYGYVGSMGNALGNENKLGSLGSTGTSYRYTDIVKIDKAGTTVSFTEGGSGSSGFCARTGYSISSWKADGDSWVLDTEGANYPGTDGVAIGIATRNGDKLTYTYTTSRDNEYLRFCFCITGDKDASGNIVFPKIYSEYTGQDGTFYTDCMLDSFPAAFDADGFLRDFEWFAGYVGSDINNLYYVNEIRPYFTEYSYTGIITVPKSGTTLTVSDSSPYSDATVYVFSSWTEAGQTWKLDTGHTNISGDDASAYTEADGIRTYTYTTTEDNEHLRICLCSDFSGTPPTVFFEAPAPETQPPVTEPEALETQAPDAATDAPGVDSPTSPDTQSESVPDAVKIAVLSFTGVAYLIGFILVKRFDLFSHRRKKLS